MNATEWIAKGREHAGRSQEMRARYPRALDALTAVLALHHEDRFFGEPGDYDCPHDADYDGERHFDGGDGWTFCADTASQETFCAGCPVDDEGNREPFPCPTVRAINAALAVPAKPKGSTMNDTIEVRPRRAGKNTQAVEQFNARFPVGTPVLYWPGVREGEGREGVTRSPAWLMGGHSPVVTVDGYPGGIALTHVVVPRRAPHVPQE